VGGRKAAGEAGKEGRKLSSIVGCNKAQRNIAQLSRVMRN
jgi:hypothetical protein